MRPPILIGLASPSARCFVCSLRDGGGCLCLRQAAHPAKDARGKVSARVSMITLKPRIFMWDHPGRQHGSQLSILGGCLVLHEAFRHQRVWFVIVFSLIVFSLRAVDCCRNVVSVYPIAWHVLAGLPGRSTFFASARLLVESFPAGCCAGAEEGLHGSSLW